jgi:hypothetical protein
MFYDPLNLASADRGRTRSQHGALVADRAGQ